MTTQEERREPPSRRPAMPWHPGRGHPSSEGPAAGLAAGTPEGSLVRPYTLTRGRVRPSATGPRLDLITIVVAARDRGERRLDPECRAILELCRRPISVAEVSARLDIPLTVVRVLLGDLLAAGDIRTRAATPAARLPEKKVLQAVLDGIRRL
ncbi:Protein of unknown function [Nocardiopsis flavescens]|uniref:DUF742 domain-containing protein n=1 Tax=Nocardiopsis flavescens TaxID=758803 RepID=A0A1M6VG36_9ACTN|nr:DUF742 domain-containing protein [Nocardiopsis flavescens]SHK80418.1 Protein of unknown function [Nocardiopsis flavescens]